MTAFEIVELVILILGFLAVGGYCLYQAIKNKWIGQLMETIEAAMKEAEEKWPEGHGDEKREYVLAAVEKKCEELKIPYTLLTSMLTRIISQIVSHWNILK